MADGPRRVDLGRLAAAYGHRLEAGAAVRAGITADAVGLEAGWTVLDVGGGRGGHAAIFAGRGATALLVDPSPDMVAAAVGGGVPGVVGRGEALPVGDAAVDLVYFHLSIHHGAWPGMLTEAARVARPGGSVWVWTLPDEYHRDSYLARWFPSVAAIDAARFPPVLALSSALAELGMPAVASVAHHERIERTAGQWLAAVRAGFVSTLHLISDEELEAGVTAFERRHPDPSERVEYELHYVGLHARRPGLVS